MEWLCVSGRMERRILVSGRTVRRRGKARCSFLMAPFTKGSLKVISLMVMVRKFSQMVALTLVNFLSECSMVKGNSNKQVINLNTTALGNKTKCVAKAPNAPTMAQSKSRDSLTVEIL